MGRVLILSSLVTSSRVGGLAQALLLSALGHEARLAPTVAFGRHPGLGAPGGAALDDETFGALVLGAEAAGAREVDAVLTGYFASAAQVAAAADLVRRVRAEGRGGLVLVDPILGDETRGIYVRPGVEAAVARDLAPLADLLAPNLFELGRLSRPRGEDPFALLEAARPLASEVLVTGAPSGPGEIGVLYVGPEGAFLASHARSLEAPKGAGDLLKALFLAARLSGEPSSAALARAVGALADGLAGERDPDGGFRLSVLAAAYAAPQSPVRLVSLAAGASA